MGSSLRSITTLGFAAWALTALAQPAEAKISFTKDSDGDGIRDKKDRCAYSKEDFNGIEDGDGCPDDADEDGVADGRDRCTHTKEDMNGYEDDDGCPDDSDGDGIPNFADRCPLRKGEGEDGCAREEKVATAPAAPLPVMPTVVPISPVAVTPRHPGFEALPPARFEPILFPVGSESLYQFPDPRTPRAVARCNELLRVLLAEPSLKVYLVGHASEEGGAESNLTLSQRRADSVRSYLLANGISPDRIINAVGRGTADPYDRGLGNAARRLNRRVEVYVAADAAALPIQPTHAVPQQSPLVTEAEKPAEKTAKVEPAAASEEQKIAPSTEKKN